MRRKHKFLRDSAQCRTCRLRHTTTAWEDLPASYHGASGALSFADGHAEIKKWTDTNVRDRGATQTTMTKPVPASPNQDLLWLQARTTSLP